MRRQLYHGEKTAISWGEELTFDEIMMISA